MRPRKWVLALFFVCLTLFAALYLVKKRLEKNRDLENLLIQSISPFIKGSINVGRIRLGFFSAHLYDVSLSVPLESFLVKIHHIKVGFSFRELVVFKGDISKAINRIIFIDPEILYSIASRKTISDGDPVHSSHSGGEAVGVPEELPVPYIIIKNAKILLVDRVNDTICIGQKLQGTLTDHGSYTNVTLAGRSGSDKENFYTDGNIGWKSGVHSINVSIKNAQIEKPVAFENGIITNGTLDVKLSVVFSDTLSLGNVRTSGQLAIRDGTIIMEQLPVPLESVSLHLSASGNTWNIDKLTARYKKADVEANGFWSTADTPSLQLDFLCSGINLDSLFQGSAMMTNTRIGGEGWITGAIRMHDSITPVAVEIRGEGFDVGDFKNLRFSGEFNIDRSFKDVTVDSLIVKDDNICLNAEGHVSLDTPYVFDCIINGNADTLPEIDGLSGNSIQIKGRMWGTSLEPRINVHLAGSNIRVNDIFLGDQTVTVESNKSLLKINLKSHDGIVVNTEVSAPFSGAPFAKMHVNAQSSSIKSILKRNHCIAEIDSGYFDALFQGWKDDFEAEFSTAVKTKTVNGDFIGMVRKYKQDTNFVHWKCNRKTLKIDGIDIDMAAAGSFCKDSMVIDTLSIAGGIHGAGTLLFTTNPFEMEVNCNISFPMEKLLALKPQWASADLTGNLSGHTRISGTVNDPHIRSEVRIRDLGSSNFNDVETDAIITWSSGELCVLPFVLRKNNRILASFDTVNSVNSQFSLSGEFENIDLQSIVAPLLPKDIHVDSRISGIIASTGTGFPLVVKCSSPSVVCNKWKIDSLYLAASCDQKGIHVRSLKAQDGQLMHVSGSGFIPWSLLGNNLDEADTIRARIDADGDFLAFMAKNVESPIAGYGPGTANISFVSTPGSIKFTEGAITVPKGVLTLRPIVLDDIKNFSFSMNVDSMLNVHTYLTGKVKRRRITISSTHRIPDGFSPFEIGPFNFGMIEVKTPDKGIDIHLPGLMPVGELGDIEFKGKDKLEHFTLSGPLDRPKISGTWLARDLDFTFPFLNTNEIPWDFDPFPYFTWDFDVKPGNRRVLYFWDLGGKRRRIMRFLEGYIDPTSIFKVRGRDIDNTFSLHGQIRSFKGALYYGKTFDRNFDAGLEFVPIKLHSNRGYDNMPILWGSVEALSDTSRLNRIKVTCMIHDPATNGVSEKGRLVEGKSLNVSFQLSNDFEGQPGESEREFFRQAGLSFSSLGGAGELVSDFGEQFFHRYLLQRWERKLAKKIGVDVINIESSITSNYFNKLYSRQFEGLVDQDDYLALANLGITVGRYFFHDYLFFKARGELIPIDTLFITPEYSVGMEFQPNRFFIMDFNYGVHKGDDRLEHDPRVMLQLTLPMTRIRKLLKF
jgi:hypothetical protein